MAPNRKTGFRHADMSGPPLPPINKRTNRSSASPVTQNDRVSSGNKHLAWVRLGDMRISPRAQRKHDSSSSRRKIEHIGTHFDPDKAGTLTVNLREGIYWIIDGGHRYHGVIIYLGTEWEDQKVQCWVYEGLTEAEEADVFLSLNDVKQVSIMDKFQRALVANYKEQTDIDRIVRAADLTVGTGREAIGCVGAITAIYSYGPRVLSTTLRIIRDSYGMPGFSSKVIEGTGLFVANYENQFNETTVIEKLSSKKGGVNGLTEEAQRIRAKYGITFATGVAASIVETYNHGLPNNGKLNGWWSTFQINGNGRKK